MNRLISVVLISFMMPAALSAQHKGVRFHSINSGGLIIGAKENNVLIQSVNGFAVNTFFLGLGAGFDYYKYNTVPLFADVRKTFGKRNLAFAYGDIGTNFSHKNKPGDELGFFTSYKFREGLYTDVGLGYKATLIKRSFMLFTIGYSYKSLKNRTIATFCTDCEPNISDYTLGYHKILLKAGFEL